MEFVTARTYPIDEETGKFQSDIAEFAYGVAAEYGLTRDQFRRIMQAIAYADDKSKAEYAQAKAKQEFSIKTPVYQRRECVFGYCTTHVLCLEKCRGRDGSN